MRALKFSNNGKCTTVTPAGIQFIEISIYFGGNRFFFYKGAVSSLLAAYTIVYDLSKLSQKKKKKKRVTVRTRHRKATYDDIYFQMKIMS